MQLSIVTVSFIFETSIKGSTSSSSYACLGLYRMKELFNILIRFADVEYIALVGVVNSTLDNVNLLSILNSSPKVLIFKELIVNEFLMLNVYI